MLTQDDGALIYVYLLLKKEINGQFKQGQYDTSKPAKMLCAGTRFSGNTRNIQAMQDNGDSRNKTSSAPTADIRVPSGVIANHMLNGATKDDNNNRLYLLHDIESATTTNSKAAGFVSNTLLSNLLTPLRYGLREFVRHGLADPSARVFERLKRAQTTVAPVRNTMQPTTRYLDFIAR